MDSPNQPVPSTSSSSLESYFTSPTPAAGPSRARNSISQAASSSHEQPQPLMIPDDARRAADMLRALRARAQDMDGTAACDYCRRRKIKCDREKPRCGNCAQSDRQCTSEDVLRKRGPPSKKEKAILEAAGITFKGSRPRARRQNQGASSSNAEKAPERAALQDPGSDDKRLQPSPSPDSFSSPSPEPSGRDQWSAMQLPLAARPYHGTYFPVPSFPPDRASQQLYPTHDAGALDYGRWDVQHQSGISAQEMYGQVSDQTIPPSGLAANVPIQHTHTHTHTHNGTFIDRPVHLASGSPSPGSQSTFEFPVDPSSVDAGALDWLHASHVDDQSGEMFNNNVQTMVTAAMGSPHHPAPAALPSQHHFLQHQPARLTQQHLSPAQRFRPVQHHPPSPSHLHPQHQQHPPHQNEHQHHQHTRLDPQLMSPNQGPNHPAQFQQP